jgi:glycosyltransferase involved in cell wall biosynthesis
LKILQISASYKPAYLYGGPIMSVAKLCEQLIKAGCVVEVFTTTANGTAELPVHPNKKVRIDGVDVTYFDRLTKDHSHFSPRLLKKLWTDAQQFDLIHIHAWWNLVSVLSAFIALLRGVPLVISPRGTLSNYSFNNKNNLSKKLLHSLLGNRTLNGAYIHVTSEAEGKDITDLIKPKAIFNISNFVNIPTEPSQQQSADHTVFKLIFFSRIDEKKGLDILLQALPAIKVPYHLTIAGDGNKNYIEDLKDIAVRNKTDTNISWIGFQNKNKFDILHQQHLMVLSSYNENFGNVVIESLSVGTAVLISRQVGLADYVVKNNLGWLCQTTPQSVSDAINNIITDKLIELTNIRESAPSIIRKDFNEHNLVQKYIGMYQQIIDNERI